MAHVPRAVWRTSARSFAIASGAGSTNAGSAIGVPAEDGASVAAAGIGPSGKRAKGTCAWRSAVHAASATPSFRRRHCDVIVDGCAASAADGASIVAIASSALRCKLAWRAPSGGRRA
jgi:hypothetical protein